MGFCVQWAMYVMMLMLNAKIEDVPVVKDTIITLAGGAVVSSVSEVSLLSPLYSSFNVVDSYINTIFTHLIKWFRDSIKEMYSFFIYQNMFYQNNFMSYFISCGCF